MTATHPEGSARAARRTELLAVAHEMFSARGYHGTSMHDIAEGVGVSKPVLYRHFPGKLALYRVLAQDAAHEMVRAVTAAVRETTDNRSRVDAAVRTYYDAAFARGGAARLLFDIDARTAPEIGAVLGWATSACVDVIAEVVREDTALDADGARIVAAGLVGLCTATARHCSEVPGTDRADSVALTTLLAWGGISSFPEVDAPGHDSPERRT